MEKRDYRKYLDDYMSGASSAELGRKHGINPGQMYRGLKSIGIEMRGFSESGKGRIMPSGKNSASYKGGTVINKDGYVSVRGSGKFMLEHRLIAERVLDRRLKRGEVVHHINGNRSDNRHQNLLICTDAYHRLIHTRQDALENTGNTDYRRCIYCSKYDAPKAMTLNTQGKRYHKSCAAEYQRKRRGD